MSWQIARFAHDGVRLCWSGFEPYRFIRFGDIRCLKPYESIRPGDIHGLKPFKFIGFGDSAGALLATGARRRSSVHAPALLETLFNFVLGFPPPRTPGDLGGGSGLSSA